MFRIRNVVEDDLNDLFELSKLEQFINLPNDEKLLKKQIESSVKSFYNPSEVKSDNYFIFVLEDLEKKKVIGVSMIHGQHGTEEEPHYFFRVTKEEKFSETINTGFIHGILQLDFEPNGYTEVGGLVLDPSYRGNPFKLGKQLSFVRFLYMGQNPNLFTETIHTELLPPLDDDGNPPLWEAIGRKFTNMHYHEADKFSRLNKEFIFSLFPQEKIYKSMLPLEAREAIGKVGVTTAPVKKMMESIGFKYMNEVDPFDGGPHYRCPLSDIKPIKETIFGKIQANEIDAESSKLYLIDLASNEGFNAVCVKGIYENGILNIDKKDFDKLNLSTSKYSFFSI